MKKAILEGLTEIEQNKALKHVKTGFQNMGVPSQFGSYNFARSRETASPSVRIYSVF